MISGYIKLFVIFDYVGLFVIFGYVKLFVIFDYVGLFVIFGYVKLFCKRRQFRIILYHGNTV